MDTIEMTIEKIKKGECSKDRLYEQLAKFIEIQQRKALVYTKDHVIETGELLSLIWLGIEKAAASYSADKGCLFLTWAASCIKFCILDELKRLKPNRYSLDDSVDGAEELTVLETVNDPAAEEDFLAAENKIDGKSAMAALKSLSEEEQKIITLCCIKNVPLSAAAREMNITVSRARHLKIQALSKLKKIITQNGAKRSCII